MMDAGNAQGRRPTVLLSLLCVGFPWGRLAGHCRTGYAELDGDPGLSHLQDSSTEGSRKEQSFFKEEKKMDS